MGANSLKKLRMISKIHAFLRWFLTASLVFFFLLDALIALNTWQYRPWLRVVADEHHSGAFRVISIWHWTDSWILGGWIAFQIALIYGVYRSWKLNRTQA
jgi:hypothetical protein